MSQPPNIDGVLIQWGDRLFYPGNRIVRTQPQPRLSALAARQRAAAIHERIEATVVRRAPQVMVKVTGGGRGMKAIAAHLRYISRGGTLEMEDERGQTTRGKDALHELADDWRYGGSLIADISPRREPFNIMLSMPRGTDPLTVQWAAREFAKAELADHKLVMVLHDHQANPHVHISVRAESKHGRRLNPRKTDLHRWRETFAEKLRERGVEAEATRQAARNATRNHPDLWRVKAAEDGRLLKPRSNHRRGAAVSASRAEARRAWQTIAAALAQSGDAGDRKLALPSIASAATLCCPASAYARTMLRTHREGRCQAIERDSRGALSTRIDGREHPAPRLGGRVRSNPDRTARRWGVHINVSGCHRGRTEHRHSMQWRQPHHRADQQRKPVMWRKCDTLFE